jgi:general stress protein 26
MKTTDNPSPDVQKLAELIRDIEVAMLTTVEDGGTLHSRPMMTQKTSFDGSLWFFTSEPSAKVAEVRKDRHVNLTYSDPAKDRYVSVSGIAQLSHDRAMAAKLWNPVYRAWFPQGLEDPSLVLLRVQVQRAEYWETRSGKLVQLVGFAKALLTGKPATDLGTNHELRFSDDASSLH